MLPVGIPKGMEREGLTKVVYGPPKGVPDSECGTLETLQGTYLGGVFDGADAIVTYWRPSEQELQRLVEGIDDPSIEIVILIPLCPVIQVNVV